MQIRVCMANADKTKLLFNVHAPYEILSCQHTNTDKHKIINGNDFNIQ